jgi:DNA-binding response OmpR family regulator
MSDEKPLILLVEPDRALSDLIMLTMHRRGYAINRAENLAEAATVLKRHQPLLVILDLFAQGGSGLQFLKDLQTRRLLIRPIVIVISSYGFQEIVEQAIQAGASDFLLKPFDVDILSEKVSALILNRSVDHTDSLE